MKNCPTNYFKQQGKKVKQEMLLLTSMLTDIILSKVQLPNTIQSVDFLVKRYTR